MYRVVVKVYQLLTLAISGELGAAARCHEAVPRKSIPILPHITSWEKEQNAEFKVWFPLNASHFLTTVKSDNHKGNHRRWNHRKSGAATGRVYSGLELARHSPSHRLFHFFLIITLKNRQGR